VRFEVLKAVIIQIKIGGHVTSCSSAEWMKHFSGGKGEGKNHLVKCLESTQGKRGIAPTIRNFCDEMGWVVNVTPRPFYF
jgi:hypothetical protein